MANKVIQRIDGVLKHINVVQKEINGVSFDDFKKQTILPDAISFNLAQIGERMNKLEEILMDKYPSLPWKQARKMRNIIVHDYDNTDYKIVYDTATIDLPILKVELQAIKDDINHVSEKTLETDRLILRPWNDFDAYELLELAKEPEIGFWCGFEPHKHIRDSLFVLHNILEAEENYAVCLKENKQIIGSISLSFHTELASGDNECELGYWVGKPFWNNGYITEASKELIRHGFEDLSVTNIWCGYYDGNERSKRVQEKLGFKYHHTCYDAVVPQLKITRIGHSSLLTKEHWKDVNS